MEIVGGAIISMVTMVFVAGIILVTFGLPIWAIVDCISSKDKSTGAKIFWVILTVFFWTLGALVYGLIASSQKALKNTSIVCLVLGILCAIAFTIAMNGISSSLSAEITRASGEVKTLDTSALDQQETANVQMSLLTLSHETGYQFRHKEQWLITPKMYQYYRLIVQDHKIDRDEYQDWMEKFKVRGTLKENDIKEAIKQKSIIKIPVTATPQS